MEAANRLEEIKRQLSPDQLRYLNERLLCSKDAEAARNCGISPNTMYGWPEKALLNEALNLMLSDGLDVSLAVLRRNLVKAAKVKAGGLDSKKEAIKQSAATEILDRFHGKPTQQNNVNLTGGPLNIILTWGDTESDSPHGDSSESA